MIWRLAIVVWLAATCLPAATNELSESEVEGRRIVQRLLQTRPPENSTNSGTLKIFRKKETVVEIPVRFEVTTTPTVWRSVYQASFKNGASPSIRLTATHQAGTNFYELATLADNDACCATNVSLKGNQTMIPFAGSDFWIADLGLEFLRWPKQAMIKRDRRGNRACYLLESTNPAPGPHDYVRVLSWLDQESVNEAGQPAIIYAEAWDAKGKLKEFEPKNLEKVEGEYQLQKMEIKNLRTGSRTRIEFNFDQP
jgi:hypothetical protein